VLNSFVKSVKSNNSFLSIQNVTEESLNSCIEQLILNLKLLVLDKFEFLLITAGAGSASSSVLGYPKFEQKC